MPGKGKSLGFKNKLSVLSSKLLIHPQPLRIRIATIFDCKGSISSIHREIDLLTESIAMAVLHWVVSNLYRSRMGWALLQGKGLPVTIDIVPNGNIPSLLRE
jgi:hypothetical protein